MLRLAPSPQAPRFSDRPTDAIDRAVAAHDADPLSESGRALAGLPLRFAPEPEAPSLPAPGADWTLADTIGEIERRGAQLVMTSRGLRVRHANRLPDLARNVARHERALAVRLRLGNHPVPVPFDAAAWDPAVRLHAAWFALEFEAPPVPFALRPGETCVDASLLRAGIAGRVAAGPEAPSATRLRSELAVLFEGYAPSVQTAPVATPRRLAA
ncbi:MAG TPA: hypothetical protein EYQ24_12990 [Bacteroidetes bacterium]|nr:hypothetical protein [Bacteroidota bacterium]